MSSAWNNPPRGGRGAANNGGNRLPNNPGGGRGGHNNNGGNRPPNNGGSRGGSNGGIRPPNSGNGGPRGNAPPRAQGPPQAQAAAAGVSAATSSMGNMNIGSGGGGGGASGGIQAAGSAPRPCGSQASGQQGTRAGTGTNGSEPPGRRGVRRHQKFEGDLVLSRKDVCKTATEVVASKRGTGGQRIELCANFFPMSQKPNWNLFNHRVDFKNCALDGLEEERTFVKKQLFAQQRALMGLHIFDGTNLYTIHRLSPNPMVLMSQRKDGAPFEITIKLVDQVAPTDLAYLQFFNIIMRKCLSLLKFTLIGRHYFDAAAEIDLSQIGYRLIPGFITNIRQYETQLMMSVEITHRVLRESTCLNTIQNFNYHQGRVGEILNGSVIMTRYNNRTYRIDDIDWSQSPRSIFDFKGTKTSIVEYYMNKYQIKIQEMNQPLLVSNPRKEDLHRGDNKKILLVPELCFPTGISEEDRKNYSKMSRLAEHLQQNPVRRAGTTLGFMNRLGASNDVRRELNDWGLGFAAMNLVAIEEGRVLPSETLLFRPSGQQQQPQQLSLKVNQSGDWTDALKTGSKSIMFSAPPLNGPDWVVIGPGNADIQLLINTMQQAARGIGFPIAPPVQIIRLQDTRVNSYISALLEAKNLHRELKFIFTILPHGRDATTVYNVVKKYCLTDFGILNQCFKPSHLEPRSNAKLLSVVTKLVIQINAKRGGEPWGTIFNVTAITMIVGFDVYHPGKRTGGKKSYGAIVATTNRYTSKFFSKVSPHDHMTEISNLIQTDIIECAKAFSNTLPSHIILYRDGVGEGQLSHVYNTEVKQIRESLREFYVANGKPGPPKLLFIVVTKRGNARIMTKTRGAYDNPPPGTVVDNTITLPERYDFFLVAQKGRTGQTVSPTAYNVLHDDIKKSPAEVQALTFQQCHMYFNWPGTVAVPAVCQYAHKLAYLTGTALDVSAGAEPAPMVQPNLLPYLYYL